MQNSSKSSALNASQQKTTSFLSTSTYLIFTSFKYLVAIYLMLTIVAASPVWAKESFTNVAASAQRGEANAQYLLGISYLKGTEIEQNLNLSFQWFQKSAEQGYAPAMFELGERYYYGQGTIANGDRAFYWHMRASRQSDPIYLISPPWGFDPEECQQFEMAFDTGGDAKSRRSDAALWQQYENLLKKIDGGNASAQFCLGTMLLATQGSKEMVDRAHARAHVWLRKAALQGYAKAQNDLATIYRTGWGRDGAEPERALKWYLRSAKQGAAAGQFGAGIMFLGQHGTGRDLSKAVAWLQLAADQKHSGALYQLGQLYEKGEGVEKNLGKALKLYRASFEDSVYYPRLLAGAEGAYRAGLMYYYGKGVARDEADAFAMFEEAWGINYRYRVEEAALYLGVMHIQGQGVDADVEQGISFLEEAASDGIEGAHCMLAQLQQQGIVVNQLSDDDEVAELTSVVTAEHEVEGVKPDMNALLKACPLPRDVPDYLCCF